MSRSRAQRNPLAAAAAELRGDGVRALGITADVADAEAVEAAAERIETELGPIESGSTTRWRRCSRRSKTYHREEFRRGTEVTYLGQVHGTMAALPRMRAQPGTIVNVGSALAYRAVPLQSVYCGAKFAVRGFTDSLRTELCTTGAQVHLAMVHLPAVNTPQFDWALNKTGKRPQPMPPIYQPEVPARAIVDAASHRRVARSGSDCRP